MQFTVVGVLQDDNSHLIRAIDVTNRLRKRIDALPGSVAMNNGTMATDPADGISKDFGAVVAVNGTGAPFGCRRGRTIDFYRPVISGSAQRAEDAKHIAR